jgi:hypothetical protein
MNNERFDALVKAIVKDGAERNVPVMPDDPAIVLAVIMNNVVEDQSAAIMAALNTYREEHECLAHQWRQDAKSAANTILNAAVSAGRDSMAKTMSEGAEKVVALVTESIERVVAEQRAACAGTVREMKRLATWMLAASGAAMVLAVLLVALK